MTTKDRVTQTKNEHPEWGYKRIAKELGLFWGTVRYHLSATEKGNNNARVKKIREGWKAGLYRKVAQFCNLAHHKWYIHTREPHQVVPTIPTKTVIAHLGDNPTCYITGDAIDLKDRSAYSLDHMIPISRGGESSLENMGLCTQQANMCKNTLLIEELIEFCIKVLSKRGYIVTPP